MSTSCSCVGSCFDSCSVSFPGLGARFSRSLRALVLFSATGLVGIAALTAGGCGSGGSHQSSENMAGPEAYKPLAAEFSKVGYGWDWSGFPLPDRGEKIKFITAYPDAVVVQDTGSKLTVLEPSNGRLRWSDELANRITKFVGLARDPDPARGDRIISSSESEAFVVSMRTGEITSRQRFEKVVNTRPVMFGTMAVYGTPAGELMGHNIASNLRVWGYMAAGPIEFAPVRVGFAVGGVTQDGFVSFVDPVSGSLIGRTKLFGGVATEPVSDGNLMFVASLDQSLYAISPGGTLAWRHRTSEPLTTQPAVVGNTVYCSTADEGFTAFDAATGSIRWSTNEVTGTVLGTKKGRLVVWNGSALTLVDAQRGTVVERANLPGLSKLVFDSFDDGNLYAVNSAGVVGKFLPK